MVNAEEVKKCLDEWLENPYWAKMYNEAPSEMCKRYIALDFYYSDTENEAIAEMLDALETELSKEDWEHLLKFSEGPERGKIMEKLSELE